MAAAAMMQRALRNIRFFNIFKLFYASFRCDELKKLPVFSQRALLRAEKERRVGFLLFVLSPCGRPIAFILCCFAADMDSPDQGTKDFWFLLGCLFHKELLST
jgi:hypothetical protein